MSRKILFKSNKEKILNRITKFSVVIWVGCIISVFAVLGYVVGIKKEMFDKAPDIFAFSLLGLILLGCLVFLIGSISFTTQMLIKKSQKKQNTLLFLIKLFFTLAILPLYLLIHVLKPLEMIKKIKKVGIKKLFKSLHPKTIFLKIITLLVISFVVLPIWIGGYTTVGFLGANQFGYLTEDIAIVGTGSMYPTWAKGTKGKSPKELAKEIISTAGFLPYPNGIVVSGKRFFGHTLNRGDIIIWENDSTRDLTSQDGKNPAGLLKRLIGLPGDTIELRDGTVYLNGEPQKEPYIAKPHSTFGERFLKECQVITVPEGEVFAMGDNRKGSADSREIGFTPIEDISYVLSLSKQKDNLDKNWHDATNDLTSSTKPKIDKKKFIELLNQKREEKGITLLEHQPKLDKSAFLRGEAILKYDDFGQEGTYTMEKSMVDANYWNTYWWEVSIQGYYEADELIEDYLERSSSNAKETWFDKKFDDIGIAEVEGTLNGCPTQIIVIHVAGYIPPNYKKEDIESWKTSLSRLKEIQPGWTNLKNNTNFYQKNRSDIDRINEIISIRIANISTITTKMESNQWLTATEQGMIKQDKILYDEQETIAIRLNSQ